MTVVRVFVSYRRDPDEAVARLVVKSIEGGSREGGFLGARRDLDVETYFDVQDRAGVNWPDRIRENLHTADIVVAVIGPNWLAATDQYHRRRIDQEDDWVRQELAIAFSEGKVVIPLLFDGVKMPPVSALPESLATLPSCNGVEVRTSHFDSDVQPLLAAILLQGGGTTSPPAGGGPPQRQWPYPDPPLVVKPAPLSEEDITVALRDMIPAWVLVDSELPEDPRTTRAELKRQLEFRSFLDALAFMGEVGRFCDAANHHPRWENIYRTVWINLSTWDIGLRVSHLDLILAAHIDKAYARYLTGTEPTGSQLAQGR